MTSQYWISRERGISIISTGILFTRKLFQSLKEASVIITVMQIILYFNLVKCNKTIWNGYSIT